VHGFLTAVQRGGLGLSGAEQDQYYREQVRVAQLLGASEVPASRAEVADYLQQIRPQLVCSPSTRNGARLLLAPTNLSQPLSTRSRHLPDRQLATTDGDANAARALRAVAPADQVCGYIRWER